MQGMQQPLHPDALLDGVLFGGLSRGLVQKGLPVLEGETPQGARREIRE